MQKTTNFAGEFKLYENLFTSKNKKTKRSRITEATTSVVYIWDMYLNPSKKGTWKSIDYDNVYETEEDAEYAAYELLGELDDQRDLKGDPDDYYVDIEAIPLSQVSQSALDWSGLGHLTGAAATAPATPAAPKTSKKSTKNNASSTNTSASADMQELGEKYVWDVQVNVSKMRGPGHEYSVELIFIGPGDSWWEGEVFKTPEEAKRAGERALAKMCLNGELANKGYDLLDSKITVEKLKDHVFLWDKHTPQDFKDVKIV